MTRSTRIACLGCSLAVLMPAALHAEGSAYHDAAVAEAKRIAAGLELADSIEIVGQASGVEGQTLEQVFSAFAEATGVDVRYSGSPDTSAVVQSRVQAGNPPDVADLQLGVARTYAAEGKTVDLTAAFGGELEQNFKSLLLESATYDGAVFGIYQGLSPFMVWYNPQTYTGPAEPQSWAELADWTAAEAEKGNAVWCAAQGAGGSSGFPGAQMIETLFLKANGPELYAKWGKGELAWSSPEVKAAFEEFGTVIAADGRVQGGAIGALSTPISVGYNGLTSEPAGCQVALWAAWVPGLIGETAKPGENIAFFRVPAAAPDFAPYELYQSSISIGLTDEPTTKAFLQYIASTPAQTYLASLDRWPVANQNVPSDTYASPLLSEISEEFFTNDEVQMVAGPNAMNTSATAQAFYKAVVSYMQSPGKLDGLLASIDATVK